jgi:enoyl-CoA hydratase/carnithine racemase
MSERVAVTVNDHVAEVTLSRPEKFNALDLDMFRELDAAAARLRETRGVRAVVLCGAGENFCAGIDVEMLQHGTAEVMGELLSADDELRATLAQRVAFAWRCLPVPVVCAIHGTAFGGGFQIAMGADLRYAAPGARFSIMESKWGLIPDMALSTTLRHLVAPDRIKELAFSARVFGADEALDLGIITGIEDNALRVARETAAMIARKSPQAIRGIKRLVNEAWSLPEHAALALEAAIQVDLLRSPNQAEAVRANLEKRPPEFDD